VEITRRRKASKQEASGGNKAGQKAWKNTTCCRSRDDVKGGKKVVRERLKVQTPEGKVGISDTDSESPVFTRSEEVR